MRAKTTLSRETAKGSELAGWANCGYCATHSRWYWGLKLYLLTTPEGMPVTWCLADPKLGEREVAAELLGHARDQAAVREGTVVLYRQGPVRRRVGALCRRPDRAAAGPPGPQGREASPRQPRRHAAVDRSGHRHRQRSTQPERPPPPHPSRVYARIAQRLLALAATIWHNWKINAPVKRSLIAYDH